MKKQVITSSPAQLPPPVLESDVYDNKDWKKWDKVKLAEEKWDGEHKYTQFGGSITFELWYTERFGWCIPTLTIRNPGRGRASATFDIMRRSYAVTVKDEQLISCGMGPHIKRHVTIKVKKDRFKALQPLLDIMVRGAEKANECRDRRSTRIAQTKMRRASDPFYGRW